ncbi:hypothetical protein HUU53_00840 [Candidatus Micrarchaeota archaeon]|nr:hypothetical protein [Candidatus Micrarchaeota archaeon]
MHGLVGLNVLKQARGNAARTTIPFSLSASSLAVNGSDCTVLNVNSRFDCVKDLVSKLSLEQARAFERKHGASFDVTVASNHAHSRIIIKEK